MPRGICDSEGGRYNPKMGSFCRQVVLTGGLTPAATVAETCRFNRAACCLALEAVGCAVYPPSHVEQSISSLGSQRVPMWSLYTAGLGQMQ